MSPLDFLNHLLNFAAPAAWMAVVMSLVARLVRGKAPAARSLSGQMLVNFVVCLGTLGLGLWFFGRDGKMVTYLAMAVLCASSQWVMARGWR